MIALNGSFLSGGRKASLYCALLLFIFVSDWSLALSQTVSKKQLRSRTQLFTIDQRLFESFAPDGKPLGGFGESLLYKDEATNSELSNGRIAMDSSDGFFFRFNYPSLIPNPISLWNLPTSQSESTAIQGSFVSVNQILGLIYRRTHGHLHLFLTDNKVPALN